MAGRIQDDLARAIDQARGKAAPDLVIKGARFLDLVTGELVPSDVAICGDRIVGTHGDYRGAREIDGRAKHDERVPLLCQIRGVGPYTAMLIIAEVGEIERFQTARKLCAWAGLTPTVRSSDGKARLGRISRMGSCALASTVQPSDRRPQ